VWAHGSKDFITPLHQVDCSEQFIHGADGSGWKEASKRRCYILLSAVIFFLAGRTTKLGVSPSPLFRNLFLTLPTEAMVGYVTLMYVHIYNITLLDSFVRETYAEYR
jgi:hypothetical protein